MSVAVPQAKISNGSWAATFPADQETNADSLLFMKRMLYVTFSQIISSRGFLPRKCFKKRRCDGLRLHVFNTVDHEAYECADQLRAVCETIELGYLREFQLIVMDEKGKTDEIIEVYKMGVSYGDDKTAPSMSISGQEEKTKIEVKYKGKDVLREQTRDLLVRLYQITEKLTDLPETAVWTFYILYDDDRTPKGFQARGFNRRPEPYSMAPDVHSITVGATSANHHACHVEVASIYIDDPVEFEELLSGDLNAIRDSLRSDSRDTSMDECTPSKDVNGNMNDTFDEVPKLDNAKDTKRRIKAGGGVVELEKATLKMNINDKISASSPEERIAAEKCRTPKKVKETSKSPSKVLKVSKAIRKTPGTIQMRSRKRKGIQ